MSQGGIIGDDGSINPQIPTSFVTDSGVAVPLANVLEVLGDLVAAGTNPVSTSGSGNTVTVNIQTAQAIASTDADNVGLAAFSSSQFNVDANGFVTLDNPFVGLTITGDTGGPISPSANNWNLKGTTVGGSGIQVDGSGSTLAVRMAPNYNLSDFAFQNLAAATTRTLEVNNQDNDAASSAILRSAVTGTSAADPYLQVGINSVMNYCWGIDNSDSDTLKIAADANANSATPSGGTILYKLTSGGAASYVNGNFDVTRSAGGSTVSTTVSNTSNSASSNALQQVTVAGTSAGDAFTTYTVSGTTNWSVGADNSVTGDPFVIAASTALGTTNIMSASTAGEINYPLQPAFLAYLSASAIDVTGDGTTYTIAFDTELFDQNSDYDNATYIFTAPVTGRYQFSWLVSVQGILIGHTDLNLQLRTSNATNTQVARLSPFTISVGGVYNTNGSLLVDMEAADTCELRITVSGGTKTIDIGGTRTNGSYFGGYLVC